nr:MAG TPA: putative DNA-binding domain protein [Caudoviricetes sp.]
MESYGLLHITTGFPIDKSILSWGNHQSQEKRGFTMTGKETRELISEPADSSRRKLEQLLDHATTEQMLILLQIARGITNRAA